MGLHRICVMSVVARVVCPMPSVNSEYSKLSETIGELTLRKVGHYEQEMTRVKHSNRQWQEQVLQKRRSTLCKG